MKRKCQSGAWRALLAGCAVALLVGGCSKLTPGNYAKIELGMPYAKAVSLLGDPTECSAVLNARSCTWSSGSKRIELKVVADKVVFKSSQGL